MALQSDNFLHTTTWCTCNGSKAAGTSIIPGSKLGKHAILMGWPSPSAVPLPLPFSKMLREKTMASGSCGVLLSMILGWNHFRLLDKIAWQTYLWVCRIMWDVPLVAVVDFVHQPCHTTFRTHNPAFCVIKSWNWEPKPVVIALLVTSQQEFSRVKHLSNGRVRLIQFFNLHPELHCFILSFPTSCDLPSASVENRISWTFWTQNQVIPKGSELILCYNNIM